MATTAAPTLDGFDPFSPAYLKDPQAALQDAIRETPVFHHAPLTSYVVYDLSQEGVGYSTSGGFIDDITGEIDGYAEQIISGEIEVPTAP